jgi:membrane protein YqaA with SNARE-associated domain
VESEGMEEFIASLTQFFTDWGYVGLFLSAFVAGSILPFSSEVVLVILVRMGLDPLLCLFAAASGNTLGGMTCYYMGHLGKTDWIEKYFKVKQEKIDKMQRFLQGKGALMAFFAFLPFIGEAIAIALGFMRSNVMLTSLSMFTGKLIRYIVMLSALQGALSVMSV